MDAHEAGAKLPALAALLPAADGPTVLRRLRAGDLERFHAYRCRAELARFQGWTPMSRAQAADFLDEMAAVRALLPGEWIQLAIAEHAGDALVGDVGLCLDADGRGAEIGFTLDPEHQGRGHAMRAARLAASLVFAASRAAEVRGLTDARNAASVRVLVRAGFAFVRAQRIVYKGEDCSELVYAIGRS